MIFIDFETYSEVDIKERGGKAYAMDDSTQIVCLGYAVDNEPATIWTASAEPPAICKNIEAGEKVYAFNATFDWRIWNLVGVRDFGWPRLSPGQLVDVQALCATYQIPQNLDAAGEALNIKHKKDKGGKDLVKKCCQPNKHGEQPMPTDVDMRVAFNDLFRYCARDVDAMREIVYKLPRQELLPEEQRIWEFTLEMNEAGLPIDATAVISICSHLEEYIERTAKSLPLLTDGKVCTPGQIAKIIAWCRSKGVEISNLQAETVENTLEQDLPGEVRRILELRQELGRSSTAKYKKIKAQMVYTDAAGWRVYDNLRYHGAGTGRWTGQGFQMHNLPRAKVENPEEYIQKFIDGYPVENPVGTAKALIRPMIQAPKGMSLLVADYSSIENRILAWAADDFQTLKDFEEGKDQYKTMAASRFSVPYDKVDDEQRRVGKVIILGCIAEGTLVLTDQGPVPIEQVQLAHKLWDGEKWVNHQGVLNKGAKECVSFCDTWFTPDHEVYFGNDKEEVWRHVGNTQSEVRAICSAFGKFLNTHYEQILQSATLVTTFDVSSAEPSIFKFWQALSTANLVNAQIAEDTELLWIHIQKLQGLVSQALTDNCIDGVLQSLGAQTRMTPGTRITEPEVSACAKNGAKVLGHLFYMLAPCQALTTPNFSSTELITAVTMSQATSDFAPTRKTVLTHDVLEAGDLNRFTLLTPKGPIIVSNCGYGMGGQKFKDTAKLQAGLDITLEEATISVEAYRTRYPEIKALWSNLKTAATRAVMTGQRQTYKNVAFGIFARNGIKWLAMQLPTGKALYYNSPTVSEQLIKGYEYMGSVPTITHWGTDPYTKKWSRLKLIPGRITENMVQGTAREVMAYGMLNAKKHMPYLEFIGSVHDEAIAICPNDRVEEALPEFGKRLCEVDFLPGCPIEAKSFSCERYRKD